MPGSWRWEAPVGAGELDGGRELADDPADDGGGQVAHRLVSVPEGGKRFEAAIGDQYGGQLAQITVIDQFKEFPERPFGRAAFIDVIANQQIRLRRPAPELGLARRIGVVPALLNPAAVLGPAQQE